MIYDRCLWICDPPEGVGAPFQGRLTRRQAYMYAELTVYHRRYWESVQAGTRVDRMVQVPFGRSIAATEYALLSDGHMYRIEEAQQTTDEDGLPVCNLSLRRLEANYDLCSPAGSGPQADPCL